MNRIYKVVWNKVRNCYVVVSELAKSQGKSAQDKQMSRISMRAAAVLAAFLVTIGGGTINFVQATDTTAQVQVKAEQKSEKAAAPLTADELKAQLDKAGIKAGNVENSANVISIGTKSSVTFDKYYGDANHDGKIDVSGIGPWNAIAIGQSATVHNSANAIGIGGGAGGGETVVDNSLAAIAIGTHSQIKDSQQASAYGIDSAVTNSAGGTSYGAGSKITDSKLATAVGYATNVANSPQGVAIGQRSSVTNSTQSVAIGSYSQVYNKSNNSVALGAFSTVNGESGVISVGHKATDLYPLDSTGKSTYGSDFFRRVINVADGKDAHDAATVGQLNGYVAYDKNGENVNKNSVSFGGVNGSGTELKNVSGLTFKGPNNNMVLTGTAGGKAQVKNAGNSIVLSTLGGGAGQSRPQTTISDTNEAISIGNSNTVTVDKNSDFYKNNKQYWFNGNVAVGTQVELTNAGESVGLGSSTEIKDSIASTAVGYASSVKKSTFSAGLGDHSKVESGTFSTAIGAYSEVKNAIGSVALGAHTSVDGQDNVVSVGNAANESYKRIVNMADGVNDFDAVNKKQLNVVDSKVTGLANNAVQYDGADKSSVTFGGSNGTVLKNVADIALPEYKGHYSTFVGSGLVNGVVYDTTSDSLWTENGSEATGSVAIGRGSNVRGTSGLAVGIGATVGTGDNSTVIANGTALGSNAKAGGQNGTAVGEEATVAGDNGAAFGYQAKADVDSTAIGTIATAGYNGAGESVAIGKGANVQDKQGVALGNNTEILAEQGTALGYNANVTWNGKNSVALGAGSIANEEDVVSVGRAAGQGGNISNPAITRRIVNVADGKVATDAATVGQLDAKVKGASSKVEAKDKNITVESKADENGTIYTVGLSNNLDLNGGSIAFGTTGPKLDGKGLTINNVTYVSDAGLNAGGKAITNVGTPVNDTDAANKQYVDDSIKNAGISKDPTSGDVTIGGTEGAGKVTVNKDGSASIAGTKGNGFTANADGSNTVSGNTNFTGNVTINNQQIATGTDVSGIQKQIGYDEKTKTYTKIDNGATTVIDGINKNTAAIKTNTDNIGATGKDGKLSLDNKATTVEAGINKNTADIANNAAAIQQNQESINALGGAVVKLDDRVDRVGAGAAALAALHPLDYDPANKWDFAAGYGHYKGANAVSIGTYYRPNENTMFSVGGSFGGGENMVNAGVSFKLGGGSGVTTSRTAMAAEINSLKDSNKALADNNKVLTDKVAAQDKKLADYDQKMKDMEAKLEALLKAQK